MERYNSAFGYGDANDDLYRWERLTKPRVYSRSQRLATDGDIQNWIQTVEDASTTAAAHTFGRAVPSSVKERTKQKIAGAVVDAQIHEAAYSEAQDLLSQWMSEKVHVDSGLDYNEEEWTRKTAADVKKEWRHLCGSDEEDIDTARSVSPVAGATTDIYSILHQDEDKLVGSVIDKMLDKDVVSKAFVNDLGFDDDVKKKKDPRTKMQLRHQQVKENREKRLHEKEKRLKDLKAKKDTQFQARQMIMKEEQAKKLAHKREEEALQQEVMRLRKQMEEEKRLEDEQRAREKKERDLLAQKAREEMEKQQEEEMKQQRKAHIMAEEKHRLIMMRMQEIEAREAAQNLKILQRHFSAWYNIVVERRIQMGRARATADWKLLLRAWNGWKAYTRSKTLDREAKHHQDLIRKMQRKEVMARDFHHRRLLKRCFIAWQLYMSQQESERQFGQSKSHTKSKMAAFLQAASTGALWQKDTGDDDEKILDEETPKNKGINDLFASRAQKGTISARSSAPPTSRSQYLAREREKRQVKPPTQPWQVTKNHIKLTKKQLAAMNQDNGNIEQTSKSLKLNLETERDDDQSEAAQSTARKDSSRPWEKSPFVADGYANRHLAQQKILTQQQKQIKEQQRLIEELTYLQKQQMLQQQLLQQQTQQLTAAQSTARGDDLTPLQKHIHSVQQELVQKNEALEQLQGQLDSVTQQNSNPGSVKPSSANQPPPTDRSSVSSTPSTVSKVSLLSKTSVKSKPSNKHEQFLQSMHERAEERARVKKERDEKRRKEEEEKMAKLLAEEEEARKALEEDKKRKAEAYREKKRLEKQRELEKVQFAERMKELTTAADTHYQHALVQYRGWLPWRKLVIQARERKEAADLHYQKTILRKIMVSWNFVSQRDLQGRKDMADQFYKYLLIRRCFNNWQKYGEIMSIQEEKAGRHYELVLKRKVVREWLDAAADEKVQMWHKERLAREHNVWRIQMTCLRAWKRYPQFIKDEMKRQKRIDEMRIRVAALLPDYGVDKSTDTERSRDYL